MKNKILFSIVIAAIVVKIWVRVSMIDLSGRVDDLNKSYQKLDRRLEQHKILQDSVMNGSKFNGLDLDSTKREIEKIIEQRRSVFSDKETVTSTLNVYVTVYELTTAVIIIVLLVFLIGLLKRR